MKIFSSILAAVVVAILHANGFAQQAVGKSTQHIVRDKITATISDIALAKDIISQANQDSLKVAGSKISGKWIYGKNNSVACRIKKWSSSPLETNIDFEFSNLTNKKPVNIVYTLLAKDEKGDLVRFINVYTDKQTDITRFYPPLKKGKVKKLSFVVKYISPSALELKECRVAQPNENFLTINPEMKDYKGP
jgi:hypothetical protein